MPDVKTEKPVAEKQEQKIPSPPHLALTVRQILESAATGSWTKNDGTPEGIAASVQKAENFRQLCDDLTWVRKLFDENLDELHARGQFTEVKRIRAKTEKAASSELSFDELRAARNK